MAELGVEMDRMQVAIGTLTIHNSLTLYGTTLMEVSHTGCDKVTGISTLTPGGTLQVVVSGDLRGSEEFKLFDATTFSGGDFGYYDLPTLPAPLGWDYSLVPVNGTLKVTGKAFAIEPVTVSGTNLVVAVPTVAGSNYVLQVATNLTPTIYWMNQSTNAGTGSMLILNVPIESSKPQKFVRFWAY